VQVGLVFWDRVDEISSAGSKERVLCQSIGAWRWHASCFDFGKITMERDEWTVIMVLDYDDEETM
jgi:hypothetical protein